MTCKNCGYENQSGVRYCQRCGEYLKPKATLAQEIKSWDFRSLAGSGRRDVNIAPLFTAPDSEASVKNIRLHRRLTRCRMAGGTARTAEHSTLLLGGPAKTAAKSGDQFMN